MRTTRDVMTRLLAGAVAVASAGVLSAQAPSDSLVRAMITERVDAGKYAGIVVGLTSRTGSPRVISYGPAAGVSPFDGNTLFEIGSITKTFTAAILADMVAKGEVRLDDPVEQFLPVGTKVPSRDGRKITLLDLAMQNSGLPRMPGNFAPKDPANPYADYTVQQMYDFLAGYTLPRAIGSQYEYSNLGVGLLGHALMRRANRNTWEALVMERVLAPLGMGDTRVELSAPLQRRLAPGHDPDGAVVRNWDLPTLAGAGALRSTVHDMIRYVRANADSLSRPLGATLAMTHAERGPTGSPNTKIGLLWNRTRTPAGNVIVWHNGGTAGYRTFAGYVESTGEGVVVLPNTSTSPDDIGMHLLDRSMPIQPAPKKRMEVALTAEQLDRYVGSYQASPEFVLAIRREGTTLYAQATNQPRFRLYAESAGEFFVRSVDAQISFVRSADGAVTGLVLHQNGRDLQATRKP